MNVFDRLDLQSFEDRNRTRSSGPIPGRPPAGIDLRPPVVATTSAYLVVGPITRTLIFP